ncbi:MAG TPA: glutathione S-transferase [Devosia sp.]|nr:glutathione S-transferase [Devosia sp.]
MKLFWSSRSPFVRKVMIAAHELGIADDIETVRVVVDAANPNADVMRFNPLGRIPTLIVPDGMVLQDSAVIVEYLDTTFGGSLIPASGAARWRALSLQSLADGMMEADLRWMEERRRPEPERRPGHVAGMRAKIDATLSQFEKTAPAEIHVGAIALASALAHLDFRFPDQPWRDGRPTLTSWFEVFSARPSMQATAFVDQY